MSFYQSKEYITFEERFVIGFEIHLKKCYHVWLQTIPPVYSLLFLGVVKANEPDLLKEHGGHLELTEDWARHLLKSMERVKRKGTTGKVESSEKFLQEEKFPYQREISRVILNHDILLDLVLNLDQTLLSYVSPGKYTFCLKGTTTVPIKGVDDKRQITAKFTVSVSGVQLIYQGKTKRCLPKFKFPKEFHVIYTKIIGQTSRSASSYSKK